ncbi:retrovirus-related Pol polyprotein from transposon 412 [Trichonephila clavipes]|nr:retrovirus-related Pol polyprotein from transposon 412 [Trichonephila clavipes]
MDPTKLSKNKMLLTEELDLRHVENRQIKKELEKLIQDYKPEKTASTDVTMRIILKDEEPVCQHPRRLAFTERQEVNKQIEEWLNEGIIRPSSSEYASPIVMVKKKDGSSRMCIDYRKLNQKLVKDKFPLPIIEDVLDTLQEAKVYSTLDLRNGFFHVDVDKDCRKYTSFIVPDGQFEFNKVPFGLSQCFSNFHYWRPNFQSQFSSRPPKSNNILNAIIMHFGAKATIRSEL